jgi:CBS domain-containing protein
MTAKLVTCSPEDTADKVLEMMTIGRFRHLPVMDNGAMVGLISIGDVVKVRLSELSMEKDALQGMIMGH